jgi:hypothetical protein
MFYHLFKMQYISHGSYLLLQSASSSFAQARTRKASCHFLAKSRKDYFIFVRKYCLWARINNKSSSDQHGNTQMNYFLYFLHETTLLNRLIPVLAPRSAFKRLPHVSHVEPVEKTIMHTTFTLDDEILC